MMDGVDFFQGVLNYLVKYSNSHYTPMFDEWVDAKTDGESKAEGTYEKTCSYPGDLHENL